MKRVGFVLFFLLLPVFGQGVGLGRLEAGLYAQEGFWTPTLEARAQAEDWTFSLYLQRGGVGLEVGSGLALGPLGYLGYALRGEAGPMGLLASFKGGAGPLALEAGLGYREEAIPPLFPERGVLAWLAVRYRPLGGQEVYGLRVEEKGGFRVEGAWQVRKAEEGLYTLGLGLEGLPYLLLGFKTEALDAPIWDLSLHLGGVNRLRVRYISGDLDLSLTWAHPFSGSLALGVGAWVVEGGYDTAWYTRIRYIWEGL
ncbi:MAG: hypothetical protein ACUVS9_03110 [Thermaceae bacterium]